jgi:hypothetical protein
MKRDEPAPAVVPAKAVVFSAALLAGRRWRRWSNAKAELITVACSRTAKNVIVDFVAFSLEINRVRRVEIVSGAKLVRWTEGPWIDP